MGGAPCAVVRELFGHFHRSPCIVLTSHSVWYTVISAGQLHHRHLPVTNTYCCWLMMWVYMIKSKDEALLVFKKIKALVEKENTQKHKMLRTDCGGEFLSREFFELCAEIGVHHHLTSSYSPQQNSVVERRNRTVLATTRSQLKVMKVPRRL